MSRMTIPIEVETPMPKDIIKYLLKRDWKLIGTLKKWSRYQNPNGIEIDVPMISNAPDYPKCVEFLLSELSMYEGKKVVDIYRHLGIVMIEVI